MAHTTFIAVNPSDLLSRIKNFVSDAAIMNLEAWEVKRFSGNELILKGPGLSTSAGTVKGTDEIYVGIRLFEDAQADLYYFELQGFTGYDPLLAFDDQPGFISKSRVHQSGPPCVPLMDSHIRCYISVTGRKICMAFRIGVRFEGCYLGLLKPYAENGQYPYPLVVGGSLSSINYDDQSSDPDYSFTRGDTAHRVFTDPGSMNGGVSQLRLRRHDGSWVSFANKKFSDPNDPNQTAGTTFPAENVGDFEYCTWPYQSELEDLYPNMDETYTVFPIFLYEKAQGRAKAMFGELDGCCWVTGWLMAPEDTITINSIKYLVLTNVYRGRPGDLWVMRLD